MAAGTAPLERCGERIATLRRSRSGVRMTADDPLVPPPRPRRSPSAAAPEEAQVQRPRAELREAARALPAGARAVRARRPRDHLRPPDLGAPPGPDERADPDDPHPEHRGHQRRGRVRGAPPRVPGRRPGRGAQAGRRLGRVRAAGRRGAGLGARRVRADPRADRRHPAGRPAQPEGATPPGDPAPDPRGARRLLPRVPRRHAGARCARLARPDRRHRQEDRVGAAAVLLRLSRCCRSTATSTASCAASACCRQSHPSTRPTTWCSGCSSPTRCTRPTST